MTVSAASGPDVSRFAAAPAWAARVLLAAVLALSAYGFASGFAAPVAAERFLATEPQRSDGDLYRAIVGRMADGEGYHAAAVAEHRERGYPLRPFVTVRPPLLAAFLSRVGLETARWALVALVLAAAASVGLRLVASSRNLPVQVAGVLLATVSATALLDPSLVVWHEVWTAALIALSLACRTERQYAASVALGCLALLVRELALPYLAVMAGAAALEGRRREAAAWTGAAALGLAALAAHAVALSHYVVPGDLASPGWSAAEGWRLPLLMIAHTGPLTLLPACLVGLVVPLALLGWAGWPGPVGGRGATLLAGYALAFCVVGRVNNMYWGFLFGPLLLVGLAWSPPSLRDLVRAARRSASGLAAPA